MRLESPMYQAPKRRRPINDSQASHSTQTRPKLLLALFDMRHVRVYKMTDEQPICQLCGGRIEGEVYHWNDNDLLPMHRYTTHCLDNGNFGLAGFMNRNANYLLGDGELVLRKEAPK